MGIRKKALLGFTIISFILFLAGLICILQLANIRKSVKGLLLENVNSIGLIDKLSAEANDQLWAAFEKTVSNERTIEFDASVFEELITQIKANISVDGEKEAMGLLEAKYEIFKSNTLAVDSLFMSTNLDRMNWLANYYRPSVQGFKQSMSNLKTINQQAISEHSHFLTNNFYQMIMPPIIAIIVGLLLIILFYYFISLYIIDPVIRMNEGIKTYLDKGISYSATIETNDEINELNMGIRELIDLNKKKGNNYF